MADYIPAFNRFYGHLEETDPKRKSMHFVM
jgi:hypothetical protein